MKTCSWECSSFSRFWEVHVLGDRVYYSARVASEYMDISTWNVCSRVSCTGSRRWKSIGNKAYMPDVLKFTCSSVHSYLPIFNVWAICIANRPLGWMCRNLQWLGSLQFWAAMVLIKIAHIHTPFCGIEQCTIMRRTTQMEPNMYICDSFSLVIVWLRGTRWTYYEFHNKQIGLTWWLLCGHL